jgi:hypothetical protein
MFAYIKDRLAGFSSSPQWRKEPSVGRGEPQFNLTPQIYIKLIGEHLLLLPQLLEPYDHKETLGSVKVNSTSSQTLVGASTSASDSINEIEAAWGAFEDSCVRQ